MKVMNFLRIISNTQFKLNNKKESDFKIDKV